MPAPTPPTPPFINKPRGPIKLDFTVKPPSSKSPRSILLYGPPKVGKTSSAAQLENSLIIECEPGAGMHECARHAVNNYEELADAVRQIRGAQNKPRYVVYDTIDAIEDFCRDEATLRYKKSNMGTNFTGEDVATELPNGAGYAWLRGALKDILAEMLRASERVVLIGHVRDKMIQDKGKDVVSKDIDLTGKCASIVCGAVDAVGHLTRRARAKNHPTDPTLEDLWVSFKTSETVNCGARHKHIEGREFILLSHEDRRAKWSEIFID